MSDVGERLKLTVVTPGPGQRLPAIWVSGAYQISVFTETFSASSAAQSSSTSTDLERTS
jgi:hypothetical protein